MTTNNLTGNAPKFIKNMAGDVELNIYDDIGFWGVDQNDFQMELSSLSGEPLTVRISSNGGDVQDAIAMYNMLKSYSGTVTTVNDSIAASAATLIFLAGDVRKASALSSFMTHKPMSGFYGNTDELVEFNSMLEHFNGVILNAYVAGGIDEEVADTLISSGDYWFNGETALDNGFVNDLTDDRPVENNVDLTKFANVPGFVLNSSNDVTTAVKNRGVVKKQNINPKIEEGEQMVDETAVSAKDHETAVANAAKKGFDDAITRVNEVSALDSRKGRETIADKLLSNATMSVNDIDEILQSVPLSNSPVLNLTDDLGDLSSLDGNGDVTVDRVQNFAKSLGKEL